MRSVTKRRRVGVGAGLEGEVCGFSTVSVPLNSVQKHLLHPCMCGTMSGTWNTKINQYEEGVNQGRWVTWQRNVLGEFLTGGRRSAEEFF